MPALHFLIVLHMCAHTQTHTGIDGEKVKTLIHQNVFYNGTRWRSPCMFFWLLPWNVCLKFFIRKSGNIYTYIFQFSEYLWQNAPEGLKSIRNQLSYRKTADNVSLFDGWLVLSLSLSSHLIETWKTTKINVWCSTTCKDSTALDKEERLILYPWQERSGLSHPTYWLRLTCSILTKK